MDTLKRLLARSQARIEAFGQSYPIRCERARADMSASDAEAKKLAVG